MRIEPGKTYRVKGFAAGTNRQYQHKLLSMGFTPDALFTAVRVAPLGDPIEIKIRDFLLSLRREELNCLHIENTIS